MPDDPSTRCVEADRIIDQERPHRVQHTQDVVHALRTALASSGLRAEISSRIKSPCSAQDKMRRQGVPLAELHDVCGVRVLVQDVPSCYRALQTAHGLWPHRPEAFDDYIATPKDNGYQSLHTVVELPCGHTLEIQIRTEQQHRDAESGGAAHWRYKGIGCSER